MTIDLEIFEQVEAFILDELNAEDHASFVEKLESDNELKKETDQYKSIIEFLSKKNVDNLTEDIQKVEIELSDEKYFEEIDIKSDDKLMSAIEKFGDNELRKDLGKVEDDINNDGYFDTFREEAKNIDESTVARVISLRRILTLAATVCIAIGGAIWMLNSTDESIQNVSSYTDWGNVQVEKELLSLENIGFAVADKIRDEDFKVMLVLLSECTDNQCRILHLESHLSKYPNDSVCQYFKARSLLSKKSYGESLAIFQKLIRKEDFKYAKDTQWYYALTLFELEGCDQKVKDLLQNIIKTDNTPYREKARDLLKNIKCLK